MYMKKYQRFSIVADVRSAAIPEDDRLSWQIWTHGSDIMKTFKKVVINKETGETWKPPSEYRNDFQFKINRDNIGK